MSKDKNEIPIILVTMPFGMLDSPSLALGILQARIEAAGMSARSIHFTLDYADLIGPKNYERISWGFPQTTDLLGEWIFSHAIDVKSPEQDLVYLRKVFGRLGISIDWTGGRFRVNGSKTDDLSFVKTVIEAAASAIEFIHSAAGRVLQFRPKIVGITSVFQQNLASVALAARLKALDDSVRVVLGGANCEGPMGLELSKCFPSIDFVVSGEADFVAVPICRSLLADKEPFENSSVQMHLNLSSSSRRFLQASRVSDLSTYTAPSFRNYFNDVEQHNQLKSHLKVQIPMESSRGCWWGAKQHCTFCGLNGSSMSFRSRDPQAVVEDIKCFQDTYPDASIFFVDNIMDYKYFNDLLPRLAAFDRKPTLFYEIKSNVDRSQVKALRMAGVRRVQPGIESFSDQVLKIIRKGVRGTQNLQLLKWCAEFGVFVDWNFLWGFPGEDPNEYDRMAELVPLISHLPPPSGGLQVRVDRFSPNFENHDLHGFKNIRACEAYNNVYSMLPDTSIFNLAYFFDADSIDPNTLFLYTSKLGKAISQWKSSHASCFLFYMAYGSQLKIYDSRSISQSAKEYVLPHLESRILLACASAVSGNAIYNKCEEFLPDDITEAIHVLSKKQLLWIDGERYLSLAISHETYSQYNEITNSL